MVPCEVAVRSVVPAVKALMATELVEKHGLNQERSLKFWGFRSLPLAGTLAEQEGTQ
jgi:hypothetical protein